MQTALFVLVLSGGLLVALSVLLVVEQHRGERIVASRIRDFLDRGLVALSLRIRAFRASHTTLQKKFRALSHYIAHGCLFGIHKALTFLDERILRLQRRNKNAARKLTTSSTPSHFEQIAQHKESIRNSGKQRKHSWS